MGKILWHDGSFYEGEFSYDAYQGKGRLITTEGNMYEGD